MSALNTFVIGDEAHVVTDGIAATFGVVCQFTNKTLVLPHLGAAFGLRGNLGIMNRLRFECGKYKSQSALIADLPARLRSAFRLGVKVLPKQYGFDIAMVGRQDGMPYARLLSSVMRPGQPAFSWADGAGGWVSPNIDDNDLSTIGALIRSNVDAGAIALVDAQRKTKIVPVGGFVQITTVNARGINTRLLKTYPDAYGKKLVAEDGLSAPQMRGDYRLA